MLAQPMVFLARRARGMLLRVVRRRPLAVAAGLVLIAPAIWLQVEGPQEAWWIEGLSLVFGATGVAFLFAGIAGVGPDWVEPDSDHQVR